MAARRSSSGRKSRSSQSRVTTVPSTFNPAGRLSFILLVFAGVALILTARLVFLSLIVGPENAEKARDTRTMAVELPARRGTIYDRNGVVLATSVDATTIYCNPYEVTDPTGEAAQLAAVLGGEAADYLESLTKPDTSFAYVYQKASLELGETIEQLHMDGVYLLEDSKRVYPNGQTASQIIGICDVDGNGLSGLELYYDDILHGTNGYLSIEKGANGYPIAGGLNERVDPLDGEDIVISVDLEMQEYLEARLLQAVKDIQGKGGNALLYDGATGEVVAMASTPYLNPNDRANIKEGATDLKSISTAFEPGSIFKTVTAAAVLEEGVLKPGDKIFCPAYLPADEYFVSDAHDRGDETMTFRDILTYSSNVGMSLSAERLGFGKLYNAIQRYNLTEATGIDYPGESSGFCADSSEWSMIQSYNVSFGQGVMVTPLQMTRFYGALLNDGVECQPHFLLSKPQTGEVPTYKTEKVFNNTDALKPLVSMLQSVVEEGTGTAAQIEGYAPGGKTGTAEYVGDNGLYMLGSYNISFVGFLPQTDSQLVCFVGVTEVPGDRITTPAFKDIMEYAISHYRIVSQ